LTYGNQQKEQVVEKLELIKQHNGYQSDDIILLVAQFIRWIASWLASARKLNLSLFLGYDPAEIPS